jgi:hypothetical protein
LGKLKLEQTRKARHAIHVLLAVSWWWRHSLIWQRRLRLRLQRKLGKLELEQARKARHAIYVLLAVSWWWWHTLI